MISHQKFFGLYCCLLLVHSCVYAIYDPNDGNTKKGYLRTPEISEPIVMHHKYSQVASNRPLDRAATQSTYDSTRTGRTSYTNDAENYVAQYGLECPPNATGQFPYLLNCRQFLNCWKGRGHIQSCAPGTVFNPDTLECDNPAKVICLNYRGESNTNNQFARLEQETRENVEDSPSHIYDESSTGYGDTENVKCPPGVAGLHPHPFDCAKFLSCSNGITHVQDCGPGTVFNPTMLVCDWPYKVDCSNRNSRKLNTSETATVNQDEQYYTRTKPRVYHTINRHRNNDASIATSETDRISQSGLSPGDGENTQATSGSFRVNPQDRSDDNGPQIGWSANLNHQHNHHRHHQPGTHHHHHEQTPPPQPGWRRWTSANGNNRGSSQGSWQQTTDIQGNPEPKLDWKQSSQTNSPPRFSPSGNPQTSAHSISVDQAQVQEIPSSGRILTNKTTIYYAKPVGTYDVTEHRSIQGQVKAPSQFLEPPKLPNEPKTITETTGVNKTTIYYAQPVGEYQPREFRTSSSSSAWQPIRKPTSTVVNKTVVYYATPVEEFHNIRDYDAGEENLQQTVDFEDDNLEQSQVPLDSLTPPDQEQSSSWTINRRIPPSNTDIYPTNNKPLYDIRGQRLSPRISSPTLSTYDQLPPPSAQPVQPTKPIVPVPHGDLLPPMLDTRTTPEPVKPTKPIVPVPYGDLLPPMPDTKTTHEPVQPTKPIVPVPYGDLLPPMLDTRTIVPVPHGDLLPPMLDTRTTHESPSASHPPVLHPPPESTKPISVDHSRQERVFHVYSSPPSSASPTRNAAPSIVYNTPYSGVAHSKPSVNVNNDGQEEVVSKKVVPIYTRPNSLHSRTMLDETPSHMPPPYNHNYYNPAEAHTSGLEITEQSTHETTPAEPTALPLSEALKMLLRPYFNRSGTVTEDVAQRMDQHIMNLSNANASKPPPTKPPSKPPSDSEAELIFSGEQESMNRGTQHHQYDSSFENSNENATQESAHRAGLHYHHHRHRFHHNHKSHGPNFNHTHHRHHHYPHHRHQWHHLNRTSGHSRDFHLKHPNIPNPFPTNDLGENDSPSGGEGTVAPRTEGTLYPALDADKPLCQFDCQNGKCVSEYQVCDGVNNCGNRLDETNCNHIGFEVRLSSEEGKANMGRVEVKVRGQWGYVCDDKFGMRAADVLCKELGFVLGASEVRGNSYYPPHKQMYDRSGVRYLMDEVDCLGNETSIKECKFMGWGVHDCSPDEVVGVVCKVPVMTCPPNYWLCKTTQECVAIGFLCDSVPDCQDSSDESEEMCNEAIQFRIIGGPSEMEGRVEVKYRDTWGTICDDDFGKKEAQVICRTLGYLGEASILKNAYAGGTGPIWLDQVSCIGNETTLEQCTHWAWGEHNCDHKEDVSVRCSERLAHPRAEPTTSTGKPEPEQMPEEDIDLYLYKVQRSSKAMNTNKRCGQINEHAIDEFDANDELARVVNGTKAIRGHHPWQASLRAKGRNGMSSHWCGAILITQMHVLTAAHCLIGYQKEALFIRMGDHYSKIAEPSEIDSFIQNWYIHEEFRKGHHMNNDIGLIVLKSPVMFNDYIQPICLPPKDAKYEEGMKCTISGWGSIKSGISNPAPSNNLKAAHVPIIPQAVCKEPYVYGKAITDGMFCAGYLDEGVDACDGDSGGPLACSSPNGETLYGIISWGQHCGQANKPGVYVKVSYYLDWIMEKIMYSMKAKHD